MSTATATAATTTITTRATAATVDGSAVSLVDDYRRQRAWRAWPAVLDALPPLAGRTVLDLGCGVGDLAAELAARGARVIAVDANEELVAAARARRLDNVEVHLADLRSLPDLGPPADGLWCSFAAAYLLDLVAVLRSWRERLRPGAWVALTEVDDLFGHEPVGETTRSLLEEYARDALLAGRYDFHMGGKLAGHLERAGFVVREVLTLEDRELSFDGPALPEVIDAWRARLERMRLLRTFCAAHYEHVRGELRTALGRPDHRSLCKVYSCFAVC
jgi:SAM-dependent methyltransferase